MSRLLTRGGRPWGLRWRSSVNYLTFVVSLGIGADTLIYSLPVAVIPFQLAEWGYMDLSSRTGWLLFAFASGICIGTPLAAWLSERYKTRRLPMLAAIVALIGSIIMFMLAPNYVLLVVARVLQGVSSAVIWTVGVALICDAVPPNRVGQQMGTALIGLSLGSVAGPPIGGALYAKYGFYAPFYFGVALAMLDLVTRFLAIEPQDARKWVNHLSQLPTGNDSEEKSPDASGPVIPVPESDASGETVTDEVGSQRPILEMLRHRLTWVGAFNMLAYGMVGPSLNATLPLRLWDVFGFNSTIVGLIYIAIVVPTCFSGILSGRLADKFGSKWVAILCFAAAIPWSGLLIIPNLPLDIICLAWQSFFLNGCVSPVMRDFFTVAIEIKGVGFAHVYAIFNMSYAIGTPNMYDHLSHGWLAVCIFWIACTVSGVLVTFIFSDQTEKGAA
ncbi:MFS general substrate transporter [Dacryopinax primogenitus]|uniref:MFS general substrate transporter n=1 Tax=Dacryopinax primogenitus (strain DJM 731) TaxID=1858805 RepID=M5GAP4_DACPD|nr:MFS general substrate transporter [Dacryopinax primogenitus]EJU00993.1 MFS general substrate transporter [Dacryopinax primogenitus]